MTVVSLVYAIAELKRHRGILLNTKEVFEHYDRSQNETLPNFKSRWCDEKVASVEAAIEHLEKCPGASEKRHWALQLFQKKG